MFRPLICIDTPTTMPIASSVSPTHPVRILVVDDHTLFRRGLTALLSREPLFNVVGDAADAGEALRRAQELRPDLILLDNHLPGVRGVDALPALREAAPNARILMLTVSEDEQDLADALKAGAAGYLLKTVEGDALAAAIHRVMRGESVVADEMTSKLVAAFKGASTGTPPAAPAVEEAPAATASEFARPGRRAGNRSRLDLNRPSRLSFDLHQTGHEFQSHIVLPNYAAPASEGWRPRRLDPRVSPSLKGVWTWTETDKPSRC